MGILSKFFGTEKAVDKGLELIGKTSEHLASGLDNMFYTDQEKAEGKAKAITMRMDMVKSLQDEFTPRAVTRRILALVIVGNFYLHANLWLWFQWFSNKDMADALKELLTMELQLTLLVLFFYYGYYGIKKVLGK